MKGRKRQRRKRVKRGGKKLIKIIKSVIARDQELKYYDIIVSADSVNYNGTIYNLTPIPQSTTSQTDTSRLGDSVNIVKFTCRWSMTYGDPQQMYRLIFFIWKPNTAIASANPTVAQILQSSVVSTTVAPYAPIVHDYRNQFKIISDRLYNLSSNGNPIRSGHFSKKMNVKIQYSAGSLYASHGIYCLAISNSSAPAHPAFDMMTRMNFTDS